MPEVLLLIKSIAGALLSCLLLCRVYAIHPATHGYGKSLAAWLACCAAIWVTAEAAIGLTVREPLELMPWLGAMLLGGIAFWFGATLDGYEHDGARFYMREARDTEIQQ